MMMTTMRLITATITTLLTRIPEWIWVILLYGVQEWVFCRKKTNHHRHPPKMRGLLDNIRSSSLPSSMGTWMRRLWEERIVASRSKTTTIPPPSSNVPGVSPSGGSFAKKDKDKQAPFASTSNTPQVLFRSTSLPVPLVPITSTGTPLTRIVERPSFSHGDEDEDDEDDEEDYDDELASLQSQYSNHHHHPTTTTTTTPNTTTVKTRLFPTPPSESNTTILQEDTTSPPPPPPQTLRLDDDVDNDNDDDDNDDVEKQETEIRQLLHVLKVHEQDLGNAKVQHAVNLEAMRNRHDTQLQVLQDDYKEQLAHVQQSTMMATTTTLLALVMCSQSSQHDQALDLAQHWKDRYAKRNASYRILQERLDHRRQRQQQAKNPPPPPQQPQQSRRTRMLSWNNNQNTTHHHPNNNNNNHNHTELRILMDRVEELEAELSQQQERWQRREQDWNHQRHVWKDDLVKYQGQLQDMQVAKQQIQVQYQQVLLENVAWKAQATSKRRVRFLGWWGMGLFVLGLFWMLYARNIRLGQGGSSSSSSSIGMEE